MEMGTVAATTSAVQSKMLRQAALESFKRVVTIPPFPTAGTVWLDPLTIGFPGWLILSEGAVSRWDCCRFVHIPLGSVPGSA
jgi:hypothetical protein